MKAYLDPMSTFQSIDPATGETVWQGAAATPAEVEQAVRALESVVRASAGRPLKKVIVVPQRIVNVVV